MPRTIGRLTALRVARVKKPGLYADGGGLYLQVTGDGKSRVAKSWLYRFTLRGRVRDMGLGPLGSAGLAEASSAADEARKLCRRGVDPIERRQAVRDVERLAAARGMTFKECAAAYIEAHKNSWRNAKHRKQWSGTIGGHAGRLGALPVSAIDTGLVLKVLEPIWQTKTETAARLRGRIEA